MMTVNYKFWKQLKKIMMYGSEKETRARWSNGNVAKTVGLFQQFNEYSNIQEKFPILSLRNINYRAAIDEILWIWQKRSNRLSDLNSKIWDEWEYKGTGTIGHSYGFILNKEYKGLSNKNPEIFGSKKFLNPVEYLFQQITQNPNDRRIIVNMFDFNEIGNAGLPPCAYETLWSVEKGRLHMTLIQRSGDFFVAAGAGCWNEVQYAFLQCLVARCCGLEPGNFTHFVQDLHIYDRHLVDNRDIIDEWSFMTSHEYQDNFSRGGRPLKYNSKLNFVDFESPQLVFSEKITNKSGDLETAWKLFNEFKETDYELKNYSPEKTKLKLEVAI